MRDLATVTCEEFEGCLGQSFKVAPDTDEALEIVLIEVKKLSVFDPEKDTRQAFSALFCGPPDRAFPQGIYRIENAVLGTIDVFLVHCGRDKRGLLYDATFA